VTNLSWIQSILDISVIFYSNQITYSQRVGPDVNSSILHTETYTCQATSFEKINKHESTNKTGPLSYANNSGPPPALGTPNNQPNPSMPTSAHVSADQKQPSAPGARGRA